MGAYRDLRLEKADSQRRKPSGPRHGTAGNDFNIAADHPAAIEGRTKYPRSVDRVGGVPLKSGFMNTKIGRTVTKGAWAGMPIFTLSLEERATCPRACTQWLSCYGNKMPFNARYSPGPDLEAAITGQLFQLQAKHPRGFVVRLHVLGDFYSLAYVDRWAAWLQMFPGLRVYGYTAWAPHSHIGRPIYRLMMESQRFRIRFSNRDWAQDSTVVVENRSDAPAGAIVCPAQTGATSCCATCALCWQTRRQIAFLKH